jgi:hypothetical protein
MCLGTHELERLIPVGWLEAVRSANTLNTLSQLDSCYYGTVPALPRKKDRTTALTDFRKA